MRLFSPTTAPVPPGGVPEPGDLAALIGSRICHDLISPIGAIGNGVELLMMDGAANSPEIALIAESVANANARIRFFRVAFGAATADQRIGRPEVVSILSDLTRGGRLAVDWQGPADAARAEVKLAFLAVMVCESAMAFGGRITVEVAPAGWTVMGEAARLRIEQPLWNGLSGAGPVAAMTPAQVHFALLPATATRMGRTLSATVTDTAIRISF